MGTEGGAYTKYTWSHPHKTSPHLMHAFSITATRIPSDTASSQRKVKGRKLSISKGPTLAVSHFLTTLPAGKFNYVTKRALLETQKLIKFISKMHRAPLGQLAMDGENLNDQHHQSMSQLLQSCTALHAVANNQENSENMVGQLQVRKINSSSNCINDENRGPDGPSLGGSLQGNKADLVDLGQLAALRKNRAPTMSRRNERERNRVRYLNFTFDILRQHLPGKGSKGKAKKMSKVDTLRGAIDYIHDLQLLLGDDVEERSCSGSQINASLSGGEGAASASSQAGAESEGDSLSPSGSPEYSGGSPGVGHDQMSDQEEDLGPLAGWFC